MASVPIVTELTYAELQALILTDGLNEGLQYKVTDKGWLLVALSETTLQPITEDITVLYPDAIPNYILAKNIILKSGLISGVTSELSFSSFAINYMFMYADVKFYGNSVKTTYITANGIQITDSVGSIGGTIVRLFPHTENENFIIQISSDYTVIISNNDSDGIEVCIKLSRHEF